jgi:large subunit ribosomal protein L3
MSTGLIGRKLGMTRVFAEDGTAVPVTVIEAGPCPRGPGAPRHAARLRRPPATRTTRAERGHAAKAGLDAAPRVLRSFPIGGRPVHAGATGDGRHLRRGATRQGDRPTKGRGFQGVVHRHGAGGGPATHGNTRHRKPGSIGPGTDPSRVIKGKRMPGHMGDTRKTELGLRVVRWTPTGICCSCAGRCPARSNGIVTVAKQGGRSRYD